jgi:hypothetical protein
LLEENRNPTLWRESRLSAEKVAGSSKVRAETKVLSFAASRFISAFPARYCPEQDARWAGFGQRLAVTIPFPASGALV